jgi:hypothetical protein
VLDNFQERHVRPISIICALREPGYGQSMISKRSYDEEGNAASTFFSHYISIGPLIKNEVKVRNLAAPMECACPRAQAPSFVPFLSRDRVQTSTAIHDHLGSVQLDHVVYEFANFCRAPSGLGIIHRIIPPISSDHDAFPASQHPLRIQMLRGLYNGGILIKVDRSSRHIYNTRARQSMAKFSVDPRR